MSPGSHRPRLILIPVRIALVTFLLTLLSFAVSLLFGIVGVVMASGWRGAHPQLSDAYRYIALPVAGLVGATVLVFFTASEVRRYRQSKALAEIEEVS